MRLLAGAMSSWMMLAAPAASRAASGAGAEPPALGAPHCPWPALSGTRLLAHQLGSVSFSNAAVWQVADVLVHQHGVPLSFIEASPEARVTLSLSRCTLRQLLDKIVESATGYGYGFVGPHLVLYSTDPKWQTRIDALKPASGLRLNVSQALVVQLRRLVPALRRLGVPGLFGNPESFVVQDPVRVAGPGTVVELLTQLHVVSV